MLTHEQLKAKALENREVQEEYERINREEFALLDMLLKARPALDRTFSVAPMMDWTPV